MEWSYFRQMSCILCWGSVLVPSMGAAQTITYLNAMSFGGVEYTGTKGSADISLGTNGVIDYAGSNLSGNGVGTPAQIQLSGPVGTVANIRCINSATLTTSAGNSVAINPVKIRMAPGGAYASDSSCRSNLNQNVITHTLVANTASNVLRMGGLLKTRNTTLANGHYSTANAGGTKVTLRVLFQ